MAKTATEKQISDKPTRGFRYCPTCKHYSTGLTCPKCGNVYPPKSKNTSSQQTLQNVMKVRDFLTRHDPKIMEEVHQLAVEVGGYDELATTMEFLKQFALPATIQPDPPSKRRK